MDPEFDLKAAILAEKVKHYLVTATDRTLEEASDHEFYQALALALREEIMVNWAATRRSWVEGSKKVVYYISMEYLPGRIMGNNLTKLHAMGLVREVCKRLERNLPNVLACESDPGLGNGGLGRLASCFMDSLAAQQYPAMGYGLRYQYGIFEQEIWDGVQVERPDTWLLLENPWHQRRDFAATSVIFRGRPIQASNRHGEATFDIADYEEVRALPYDTPILGYGGGEKDFSVLTLRLWTTKESPRNFELQRYNAGQLDQAAENTTLTDVLYPSDHHETGKRIRLKQEFLLTSASIQDILAQYNQAHFDMHQFANKVRIQINDTHPALVIAELTRLLTHKHGFSWEEAFETTRAVTGFTNHTVLKEAMEEWDQNLVRYLLPRQYRIIEKLNDQFCSEIREKYPNDEDRVRRMSILENGHVRMANLAFYGSHRVNGVARLHTNILKESVFKDFHEMYPERLVNVTNGVTQRRWLLHCNPELAAFITSKIGDSWVTNLSHLAEMHNFAGDSATRDEFIKIKQRNKAKLIDNIHHHHLLRDKHGRPLRNVPAIDPHSLFDIQIKRIHEYKRQLMLVLHTIMVYQELKDDPKSRPIKRTVMVGGKAAAGYQMAKHIIHLICMVARKINNDPEIEDKLKLIFLSNYNVSTAQVIIPACELSEQISTAGLEASGTGNMKLTMNGALTIGTDDGANVEMREEVTDQWWPFLFGCSSEEIHNLKTGNLYNAWDIYSSDEKIRRAIDTLKDETWARTEEEKQVLTEIYNSLLEGFFGRPADPYFILKDLPAYHETQLKVDQLYTDPHKWAEYAIHNMAGMGRFSSDRSIKDYAERIWGIEPCPPDPAIVEGIRADYAEHVPTMSL